MLLLPFTDGYVYSDDTSSVYSSHAYSVIPKAGEIWDDCTYSPTLADSLNQVTTAMCVPVIITILIEKLMQLLLRLLAAASPESHISTMILLTRIRWELLIKENTTWASSLVPSAIPPTCTDTTWLPTTVLDTVIFSDVFLTGNSACELYTVNATDTSRSCGMLLKISWGRKSTFCDKSPDSSAFEVASCNSWEPIDSHHLL